MPIRVHFSRGVAHIQVFGYATWDDFGRAFTTMIEHPDFHPGMNALWDIRAADLSQFTASELRRFAEFVTEHASSRDGARGALVIPSEVDHGLGPRLHATLREIKLPVALEVFHDLAEAEAWLTPDAAGE